MPVRAFIVFKMTLEPGAQAAGAIGVAGIDIEACAIGEIARVMSGRWFWWGRF